MCFFLQNQNSGTNLPPAYIWRCVDSDNPDNASNTCGFNLNVDMELIMELNPSADGKADCKFQGPGACVAINEVINIAKEYDDVRNLIMLIVEAWFIVYYGPI